MMSSIWIIGQFELLVYTQDMKYSYVLGIMPNEYYLVDLTTGYWYFMGGL